MNGNCSNCNYIGTRILPRLFNSAASLVLYLKPMSYWIMQKENIKGVEIKGSEHKIPLIAGDANKGLMATLRGIWFFFCL